MMSTSFPGRFARTSFSRSRTFVAVRTLVAICWRSVAMIDYSWGFSLVPGKTGNINSKKANTKVTRATEKVTEIYITPHRDLLGGLCDLRVRLVWVGVHQRRQARSNASTRS